MEEIKSRPFSSVKRMWEEKVSDVHSDTTIGHEKTPLKFATGMRKSESSELNWPEDNSSKPDGVINKRRISMVKNCEEDSADKGGRPHPGCDMPTIGGWDVLGKRMPGTEDMGNETSEIVDWGNISNIKQMWHAREATELMPDKSHRGPLSTEVEDDFESDDETLSYSSDNSQCEIFISKKEFTIPVIKVNGREINDEDIYNPEPNIDSLRTPPSTSTDGHQTAHKGIFKKDLQFRRNLHVTFIGLDEGEEKKLCDYTDSRAPDNEDEIAGSVDAAKYSRDSVDVGEESPVRTKPDSECSYSTIEPPPERNHDSEECSAQQDLNIGRLIYRVLDECITCEDLPSMVNGSDGVGLEQSAYTEEPHCSNWIGQSTHSPVASKDIGLVHLSGSEKTGEAGSEENSDSDSLSDKDTPCGSDTDLIGFGRQIMVDEKDMIDRTEEMQLLQYQYSDLDSDGGSDTENAPNNLCDLSWKSTNGREFLNKVQPITKESAENPNYFATVTRHAMRFMPKPNLFFPFQTARTVLPSDENAGNDKSDDKDEAVQACSERGTDKKQSPGTKSDGHNRKLPKTRTSTTRRKHPRDRRDDVATEDDEGDIRESFTFLLFGVATILFVSFMLWVLFPSGLPPAPRRIELLTTIGHLIEFVATMFK